jgi:hypothetical protein
MTPEERKEFVRRAYEDVFNTDAQAQQAKEALYVS